MKSDGRNEMKVKTDTQSVIKMQTQVKTEMKTLTKMQTQIKMKTKVPEPPLLIIVMLL